MTEPVGRSWARIHTWLAEHLPDATGTVLPPASEAEIDALAAELGVPLPRDLADWWRQGIGFAPMMGGICLLPPLYRPIPLRESRAGRRIRLDIEESERHRHPDREPDPVEAGSVVEVYSPAFLPVAEDGGGASLVVDLREGPRRGCVLEWHDEMLGSTPTPFWPSVAAMLTDVADALEHGAPALRTYAAETRTPDSRYSACVTGGELRWKPVGLLP